MLSNDHVHHNDLLQVSIGRHNSHIQKPYHISYFHHDNHYLTYVARKSTKTVTKYCGYKLHAAGAYAFDQQRFS
jgi:hypothetical protein